MHVSTRAAASTGALVLAATASAMFGPVAASAAPAADATFVTANEQSNLAEISLAPLAKSKGQDSATLAIASKTLSDHLTAKVKLAAAAKSANLTLPGTPNPAQLAVAAQLKTTPTTSFDLAYAQAQVTGHEQALAGARTELATTSNAQLKAYTTYYIGIATMHLNMARAEVSRLGGTPTSVPAGNGGAASTSTTYDAANIWAAGAGAVLVAGGAAIAVTRRRSSSTR